jgi:hypothetical protein
MANVQAGPIRADYIDKRRGRDFGSQAQAEHANYSTIGTLRARLTALAAGTYTAARLDAMTVNDMEYAVRVLSGDAAGI